MLTRDTIRHRYTKIPEEEPLSRVMTRLSMRPESARESGEAAELGARVEDAWVDRASLSYDSLMDSGLCELDARVVHGYLECRRGVMLGVLEPGPSPLRAPERPAVYRELGDPELASFDLDPARYLEIRNEHRRLDDGRSEESWAQRLVTSLWGRTTPAGCAGQLAGPLTRLFPAEPRASWRLLLEQGIATGSVRDVTYALGKPWDATVTSLAELTHLMHTHCPGANPWHVKNYLIVAYAEYQREQNLRRADTLATEIHTMLDPRNAANTAPDFDDAMGLLYSKLSECVRSANSYGNLFSQGTRPQDEFLREEMGRLERRQLQQTEREEARQRLEAEAKTRFADPGYRAAWVKSHPVLRE